MKKGLVNSHELNGDSPGHAKAKRKYQSLLEDHLDLQKEYVSRKRKLRALKERKEVLLDEVRFLRKRYKYLTKLKFAQVEIKEGLEEEADIHEEPNETYRGRIEEEEEREAMGGEEVVTKTWNTNEKKLKSCLKTNVNESVKKKVMWQDQVALPEI